MENNASVYSYSISGFRSLDEFEIQIGQGLNVLLGANGSGKTNFIDFIDFITVLINSGCSNAVSSAGGVARVFSQEALKRKIPRVKAKICAIADMAPHLIINTSRTKFKFEYEVDIRYSKFHTAIYIANEKIKFKNLHKTDSTLDIDSTVGSIEIHRKSPLSGDEVMWTYGRYLTSNSFRNPLRYLHAHRIPSKDRREKRSSNQLRPDLLAVCPSSEPDESVLANRSAFPALDAVRGALTRNRSFNLNPHRARSPDDISTIPRISHDGSGLSATIYHMQQLSRTDKVAGRRGLQRDSLETVVSWTQLVIPDLQSISAVADPHSGKYIAYLHVGEGAKALKIPLQSVSDGMLKWLAFVSLIVSRPGEFTFEEPENFLHPKMQKFFVEILRESLVDGGEGASAIVSTHSETIINQCKPEELVLFSFDESATRCKRIDNIDSVLDEINVTGFGLGHYYIMNVLH